MERIISTWNYWNYYKNFIQNISTGVLSEVSSGKYTHATAGLLRFGEKKTKISSTENLIKKTIAVFKPSMQRVSNSEEPSIASLKIYLYANTLNDLETKITANFKSWANALGVTWTSATNASYDAFKGFYVPFDVTTYAPTTYEDNATVYTNSYILEFDEIINSLYKFYQDQTTGFTISATGGYCDIYGPAYSSNYKRPILDIKQIVTGKMYNYIPVDIEVTARSKVRGLCRDYNGTVISGKQCRIIIFDIDNYKIIGTGLSDLSGNFLIENSAKYNTEVVVSFLQETDNICGSEIMTTISYDAI
jgi:hypothetical protein